MSDNELMEIYHDFVTLEGMLETVKDFAYSECHSTDPDIMNMGNSLEIAIEYLSNRAERMFQLIGKDHSERRPLPAGDQT
ncbi:MAG: hypothetical protein LUC90_04210 [Lachnospiraceae bacterium]|nr:hypothetical protein [Lachnospiraceae bacterium]